MSVTVKASGKVKTLSLWPTQTDFFWGVPLLVLVASDVKFYDFFSREIFHEIFREIFLKHFTNFTIFFRAVQSK